MLEEKNAFFWSFSDRSSSRERSQYSYSLSHTLVFLELATSAKGGKVLETSDEFFGEGFHLIRDGAATEDKNRESANGFWKVIGAEMLGHLTYADDTSCETVTCLGRGGGPKSWRINQLSFDLPCLLFSCDTRLLTKGRLGNQVRTESNQKWGQSSIIRVMIMAPTTLLFCCSVTDASLSDDDDDGGEHC